MCRVRDRFFCSKILGRKAFSRRVTGWLLLAWRSRSGHFAWVVSSFRLALGFCPRRAVWMARFILWLASWGWISLALVHCRRLRIMLLAFRASACGRRGLIRILLDGSATFSISGAFLIHTFGTKTFGPENFARKLTYCSMVMWTWNWQSRLKDCRNDGGRWRSRKRRRRRVSVRLRSLTISLEGSDTRDWRRCRGLWIAEGCWLRWGAARCWLWTAELCAGCGPFLGVYRAAPRAAEQLRPRPRRTPSHELPGRMCGLRLRGRNIRLLMVIRRALMFFGRTFNCTACRELGCAWLIARLAWMDRKTALGL